MSAVGRLWRRAPAWRLSLVAAIAFTGLAAMFPPRVPHGLLTRVKAQAARGEGKILAPSKPAGADSVASYTPTPDPAHVDLGDTETPLPGPGRSGIIPFAGRVLPLPTGNWQDLFLARIAKDVSLQVSILGRIQDGKLTGLMFAAAPNPLTASAGPLSLFEPCYSPGVILRETLPADPGDAALLHECWTLAVADLGSAGGQARMGDLLRPAFKRLQQLSVAVPDRMLALRYIRSEPSGWMTTVLLMPEQRLGAPGAKSRVEAWARRLAAQFRRGFDGTLTAAEAAAVAREPM